MEFEWDVDKATDNLTKHRVTFEEASTVFGDPLARTIADPDLSVGEFRYLTVGTSQQGKLIVVAHADRGENEIRIISARLPTPRERRDYESKT